MGKEKVGRRKKQGGIRKEVRAGPFGHPQQRESIQSWSIFDWIERIERVGRIPQPREASSIDDDELHHLDPR